jgi:uncharacterized protein YjbI with pentapeptide repeats
MANTEHLDILKQGVEKWNEWRQQHPEILPYLTDADLRGVDLRGAFLRYVQLGRVKLQHADLSHADCVGALLNGANLTGADLTRATLIGVKFGSTDLSNANLSNANLTYAIFQNTILSGVDFKESYWGGTILSEVDLSEVKGLGTVTHSKPSTVGIETLYLSQGNIPEVFLRGCGFPESFIVQVRAIISSAEFIQFYSCFISYSSKDHPFAERLYADLQNKGVRCWFAPEDLKIGDRFRDRIDESIRLHDKLLLILSENSVSSPWVSDEVEAAIEREQREKRTVLFPIKIDNAVIESTQAWAATIRRTRHVGDFTGWKDHDSYQKVFDRLVRDLKADETAKVAGATAESNVIAFETITEFEEIRTNIIFSTFTYVIARELKRLKTFLHKYSYLLTRNDVGNFYANWIAPYEIHLEFGGALDLRQAQYEMMKEHLANIDLRSTQS